MAKVKILTECHLFLQFLKNWVHLFWLLTWYKPILVELIVFRSHLNSTQYVFIHSFHLNLFPRLVRKVRRKHNFILKFQQILINSEFQNYKNNELAGVEPATLSSIDWRYIIRTNRQVTQDKNFSSLYTKYFSFAENFRT